jgi:hypothetical protein
LVGADYEPSEGLAKEIQETTGAKIRRETDPTTG